MNAITLDRGDEAVRIDEAHNQFGDLHPAEQGAEAALGVAGRVDLDLHYPGDLNGEVHHDGQIWSRALWDIRQSLGNVKADTIIVNGSFNFPGTTMTDLANRTVAAAQRIYGNSAATVVRKAFADRGILS